MAEVNCIPSMVNKNEREEMINSIASKTDIKSDKQYVYYLCHTYNHDVNKKVWVKAPYDQETFDILCAYIQFECAEIKESCSMSEEDILNVLEQYYDCTGSFSISRNEKKKAVEVDLYENWEYYCGEAVRIQKIESLKREGLTEQLKQYVESFYVDNPEWRPTEAEA